MNLYDSAQGTWQRELVRRLDRYGELTNPVSELRGRAASYAPRYQRSFNNLLARLSERGFSFTVLRGPRGGMHRAVYILAPYHE